jgi:hypothetical protein
MERRRIRAAIVVGHRTFGVPLLAISERSSDPQPQGHGAGIFDGVYKNHRSSPPSKKARCNGPSASTSGFFETLNSTPSTYAWSLSECANTLSATGKRLSP